MSFSKIQNDHIKMTIFLFGNKISKRLWNEFYVNSAHSERYRVLWNGIWETRVSSIKQTSLSCLQKMSAYHDSSRNFVAHWCLCHQNIRTWIEWQWRTFVCFWSVLSIFRCFLRFLLLSLSQAASRIIYVHVHVYIFDNSGVQDKCYYTS